MGVVHLLALWEEFVVRLICEVVMLKWNFDKTMKSLAVSRFLSSSPQATVHTLLMMNEQDQNDTLLSKLSTDLRSDALYLETLLKVLDDLQVKPNLSSQLRRTTVDFVLQMKTKETATYSFRDKTHADHTLKLFYGARCCIGHGDPTKTYSGALRDLHFKTESKSEEWCKNLRTQLLVHGRTTHIPKAVVLNCATFFRKLAELLVESIYEEVKKFVYH
jgi:hypothetical protein